MPFGDRTGPNGMGPMTGRGLGFCNGFNRPGYTNNGYGRGGFGFGRGRGFGRGFGYGRGFGRGFGWGAAPANYPYAPISKEDEKNYLKNEIKIIEQELNTAKDRLKELEEKE